MLKRAAARQPTLESAWFLSDKDAAEVLAAGGHLALLQFQHDASAARGSNSGSRASAAHQRIRDHDLEMLLKSAAAVLLELGSRPRARAAIEEAALSPFELVAQTLAIELGI